MAPPVVTHVQTLAPNLQDNVSQKRENFLHQITEFKEGALTLEHDCICCLNFISLLTEEIYNISSFRAEKKKSPYYH